MHRAQITPALVARLVAEQFPQWSGLPVVPVDEGGWDNVTFRLGDALLVRLPSAERYVAAVDKEHRWLPVLAVPLPLPIPESVARGRPGCGYPWPWSVRRWLPGARATAGRIVDPVRFADDLAGFLSALQRVEASDGPAAGDHSFFRGGALAVYDGEVRAAIAILDDAIDGDAALAVWEEALASAWSGPPVWVHGDVSAGNLLVEEGRLSAVIDFGTSAVGDPACDLVVAWTLLGEAGRWPFAEGLRLDGATWARGRGWALWKALITLARSAGGAPDAEGPRRVIADVIAEHRRICGPR